MKPYHVSNLALSAVLFVLLCCGGLWLIYRVPHAILCESESSQPEPPTRPAAKIFPTAYQPLRKSLDPGDATYAFLPAMIPPQASRTAFYFEGGEYYNPIKFLTLRMTLPPVTIDLLLADLQASGREEVASLGDYAPLEVCPSYELTEVDHHVVRELSPLPEGYRIFLYQSRLEDLQPVNYLINVGPIRLAFTAVNPETSEVIYYFLDWSSPLKQNIPPNAMPPGLLTPSSMQIQKEPTPD